MWPRMMSTKTSRARSGSQIGPSARSNFPSRMTSASNRAAFRSALQQSHADLRPPNALTGQRDDGRLQVLTARIQRRRITESVLQIDRRADPYQLGRLVVAH